MAEEPSYSAMVLGLQPHLFVVLGDSHEIAELSASPAIRRQAEGLVGAGRLLIPYDRLLRAFEQSLPRVQAIHVATTAAFDARRSTEATLFVVSAPRWSYFFSIAIELQDRARALDIYVPQQVTTQPPELGLNEQGAFEFVGANEFDDLQRNGALLDSSRIGRYWIGTRRAAVQARRADTLPCVAIRSERNAPPQRPEQGSRRGNWNRGGMPWSWGLAPHAPSSRRCRGYRSGM